ncbi:MAG: iron-sulfur cluster assembly protein [Bacteroidales bacterium]|nr:iron-sulfur cluster assembly protein [Bacteroidales bacterium]
MPVTKDSIREQAINCLRNVYDPEIPVNIYDLGLIYDIAIDDDFNVRITMTLTAPDCPEAGYMVSQAKDFVQHVDGVKDVDIELTFDPPWDYSRLTDAVKLELGIE